MHLRPKLTPLNVHVINWPALVVNLVWKCEIMNSPPDTPLGAALQVVEWENVLELLLTE